MDTLKMGGIRTLLGRTISVYQSRFLTLVIITLPLALVRVVMDLTLPTEDVALTSQLNLLIVLFSLLTILVSSLVTVAVLKNIMSPVDIGVVASYAEAFKMLHSYLWVVILSALIILGGFVLFVLPGAYFALLLAFSLPVAVAEGEKGFSALMKSRQYVHGRWWRVFWKLALGMFVLMLVPNLAGILLGGLSSGEMAIVATGIISAFFLPLTSVYLYTIYNELKLTFQPSPYEQKKTGLVAMAVWGLLVSVVFLGAFLVSSSFLVGY